VQQFASVRSCISADAAVEPSDKRATASPLDVRTDSLDQHEMNGPQFGSETCDTRFRQKEATNQHMEENNHWSRSNDRIFDENLRSGQAAEQRTIAVGHGNPSISCQTCPRKFHTQSAANDHMTAVGHRPASIACKTCSKKFHTQSAANEHMAATGHGNANVSCKTCPKRFHTQIAANEHMLATRHGHANISCKKCTKKFYTQIAANVHRTAVGH
jgi:hypothetical protein